MIEPTTRRQVADEDLGWIIEQEREVQAFREGLLLRDGHILDTTTHEVVEVRDGE